MACFNACPCPPYFSRPPSHILPHTLPPHILPHTLPPSHTPPHPPSPHIHPHILTSQPPLSSHRRSCSEYCLHLSPPSPLTGDQTSVAPLQVTTGPQSGTDVSRACAGSGNMACCERVALCEAAAIRLSTTKVGMCVAIACSVLQSPAVCCNALQCVAIPCSVLQ